MASPTRKIGKYNVLATIGRGGMGVVLKAMDPSLDRVVAIKMMTGGFAGEEFLKRFYREAQSTGSLHHPNVVTVHELGDQDGTPYLVMEFLEGESLDSVIAARREVVILDKISYMVQVCAGLQYAHERHVIHRDIKPANIMVLKGGQVKIVDFGIARIGNDRLTRPGQLMGSIHYMSPEQIQGATVDARTDIFSTGVALYQLLTYALPFQANDTAGTLLKIIQEPPQRLSAYLNTYPAELNDILDRALAKDPDDRYGTADEFGFDLIRLQAQLKRELVDGDVAGAERSIEKGEFTKARELLLQALKVDPQNRKANEAIRHVQQAMQRQRRSEQAGQLRERAEQALQHQQFEQALRYLDEAITLDGSEELKARRMVVEASKLRADAVREAFRKLQAARAVGNIDAAVEAVEHVLAIDPDNAVANAARSELRDEAARLERQRELQSFVREARKHIASRKFTDALEMLKKAEEVDPRAPNLQELIQVAVAGSEQERRRKEIGKFTAEIQEALNRDDYTNACTLAEEALARFPGEGVLLKLKDMAERQRTAAERRVWVETQLAAARKSLEAGDVAQALVMLEAAAQRYPTDPALHSFLVLVRETAAQQKLEARKAEVRQKAKHALRRRAYEEAIAVLKAGKAEIGTDDFDDLIQFAQGELDSYSHQLKVDAAASQAQSLIDIQEYEEAIEFLERALAELPDEELRLILADARRRHDEKKQRVTEAADAANRLVAEEKTTEAISLLESQPTSIREGPQIREAMENARRKHGWLQAIAAEQEKVRQALAQNDVDSAERILQSALAEFGDRPEFAAVKEVIQAQRAGASAAMAAKAMREAALLMKFGSHVAALEKLESVAAAAMLLPNGERAAYEGALTAARREVDRSKHRGEIDEAERKEQERLAAELARRQREQARRSISEPPNALGEPQTLPQVWATGTQGTVIARPPSPPEFRSMDVGATVAVGAAQDTRLASPDVPTPPPVLLQPAGDDQHRPALHPKQAKQSRWLVVAVSVGALFVGLAGVTLLTRLPVDNASSNAPGLIVRSVSSNPEGALIEVGDQVCVTPSCRLALPPGTYTLKAKLPSGVAVERTITLEPATPNEIKLDLSRE